MARRLALGVIGGPQGAVAVANSTGRPSPSVAIKIRQRVSERLMQAIEYALKAILTTVFLWLAYIGTTVYFPCVCYPTAYSKMQEFGRKVEAFRDRHGHLPDDANVGHVAELDLGAGYSFSYESESGRYWLMAIPGVDPDDEGGALLPFKMKFDGPWVVYNATTKAVSCGHR